MGHLGTREVPAERAARLQVSIKEEESSDPQAKQSTGQTHNSMYVTASLSRDMHRKLKGKKES